MKKLERRAFLCLLLAAALVLGMCFFTARLVKEGDDWASYYSNSHVFKDGKLAVGAVYDRNGLLLLNNDEEGQHFHEDAGIRRANLHVTGDKAYNIVSGANSAFRSEMIGYNFVTGTKGILFGSGRSTTLTVDAHLNLAAYEALAGRKGLVCVYNWKTGEILSMVSSPTYDPESDWETANAQTGAYMNKSLSATMTPGSIFKLVTTAAVLETVPNLDEWSFTCTGKYEINGEYVTCTRSHGTVDLAGALAHSCNCAYGALTLEVGEDTMEKYVKKLGLTSSYDINGITSKKGSFDFDTESINLAWAGIGQYEDQVNPISMLVYVGAIAGGGTAAEPVLLEGEEGKQVTLLDSETAATLQEMMRNTVVTEYGDSRFPGLEVSAKTGTAEVGSGSKNGWFTGYCGDYAFIVCVENGGAGINSAAPVANKVLQELM